MRVTCYCLCGDSAKGDIKPEDKADRFKVLWWSHHIGEGHGATDAKTCRANWHKAERAREKAERTKTSREADFVADKYGDWCD